MKKNKFQLQQEQYQQKQETKNYFDDDEEIDLEEDRFFDKEALKASKPFEEYFEKFNQSYNDIIEKYQMFEENYQLTLTSPDYEQLVQTYYLIQEKNTGLFDFIQSENRLFDKICASFVYVENQISLIEETFYSKLLDKMTIYGELSDLHQLEDYQLKDGEGEIMISRTLEMFKKIYDIIKKLINYVTYLINQLNLLYNKKHPIYKQVYKAFNLCTPLETIGRAFTMIYVLDCVVEQNDYLQQHWNYYKRMIKIIKPDTLKYNTNPENMKILEKILIRLDKTVISGTCLQGVFIQHWDQHATPNGQSKYPNIPLIKNNKELKNLILFFLTSKLEMFEKTITSAKEVFERQQVIPVFCVYAFYRKLYPSDEDRKLWKSLWSLQKKIPMVEGHSQVLCYLSKFMLEVCPLSKKSTSLDPKDPIAYFKQYLTKLNLTFPSQMNQIYLQFTAWLVRMDSFATSQSSFDRIENMPQDKASKVLEARLSERLQLIVTAIAIGNQIRNLLQSLLLGTLGLEDYALDKNIIKETVLGFEMLKAIEYYMMQKMDAFQPSYLIKQAIKSAALILGPAMDRIKKDQKGFGTGGADAIAALQISINIFRSPITVQKMGVLFYCQEFLNNKDVMSVQDRDEYKQILQRLDFVVKLPLYIRKVTATTYFYWCKDLLPLFFQNVYKNPVSAKRIQFLLNAISDCSRQLKGSKHLAEENELFDSFRKYVVQQFHQEYLKPLAQDIEDYLRIHVHSILIDKIQGLDPFKQNIQDIKRLLDVDQILVFDSIVNLRTEINKHLNENFYNINVINMYDMETYEQMRSVANFKFGLHLMNVYLPSQTIDQGQFDVLQIIKNIQGFVSRYTYNLYTQTFVQISGESKQIFTIGINQISDSIKTHGLGILNTNVNIVYQYIKKKILIFSQFLFDDLIHSPLNRENRWFKEMKDSLDGLYPFERAELFYKEVKKLGVFEDGLNFLDKFRILITNIGNALGIIRLLRTASLNFCSKSIEYLPNNINFEFHNYTREIGFSESTTQTAEELDEVFKMLRTNFSDSTDYIKTMVKVFSAINNKENKHLRLFYLIIPALTINYVENMLVSKERLAKKNQNNCFIEDDGFTLGLQYFLHLLDQKKQFDSLHWKKEIRKRFSNEIKGAQNLTAKSSVPQSQRVMDEINMQKELSLRKLNMQLDEYQMFFYAFNSAKILFTES